MPNPTPAQKSKSTPRSNRPPKVTARGAAIAMLTHVVNTGGMLSDPQISDIMQELGPSDRASAQRLTLAVLRQIDRADARIAPFVAKMPPGRALQILRLAVVELAQDPAGAHGIVNEAVRLCSAHKKSAPFKGLINAVLRKVADIGADGWDNLPHNRLPKYLRGPLIKAYGQKAIIAIEAAHSAAPPVDLTPKAGKDSAKLATALGAKILENSSVRLYQAGQISALAGYETGDWWVQDAAAAIPVQLMGDIAGKTALDLCAAPGGKTMQLAAAGAQVTAVDISKRRLARVQENLNRTKLTAKLVQADARRFDEAGFDIVLLDAPCSATGTIRRHPDLPFVKNPENIRALAALQAELLDHALSLLAPNGQLFYVTCSLLPAEGEDQIDALLSRNKSVKIQSFADGPAYIQPWLTKHGALRLRPDYWADQGGMDGFYIAQIIQH